MRPMSPRADCEDLPVSYGSRDSILSHRRSWSWRNRRNGRESFVEEKSSTGNEGRKRVASGLNRSAAMRCSTLVVILAAVVLYLVLGALVFHALEAPIEEDNYNALLHRLQEARQMFLDSYDCVSFESLQELLENITEPIAGGVVPNSNTTFSSSWDLSSAFFFSGTIITTIGYGNISPQTDWGKLFCICYALMGIPLFGFLLAGVGDHLGTGLRKAVAKIEMLFLKWKVSPTIVRVISALFSILLGLVLFVFVPTLIFQEVEKWSLLESAYFVVITLTTVGFGDYVAGDSGAEGTDHWYKPLVWFWILLGLAYFVSVLSMIGNWLRVLSKKTRAEMEELRAHATDWSQNIQNMSVDFRIPGKLDESFKRRRRRRRRGHRSHRADQGASGAAPGEGGRRENGQPDSQAGSRSSVSYSTSSNESESEESETGSEETQTERVQERGEREDGTLPKIHTEPTISQPLDYFGENLAYIDESSDAVSAKLHLDPLLDTSEAKAAALHKTKKRRPKRPAQKKAPKSSPTQLEHKEPNGGILPPNHPPPPPPKP